ncbi:MAG TPA: hypothetical protein VK737_05440 [Opitutales bacterium]|jgi:hypothetical protein|nr:hypothetical protein [Opitutales bacterium]
MNNRNNRAVNIDGVDIEFHLHAPFFSNPKSKVITERGVVADWLKLRFHGCIHEFKREDVRDPPDVALRDSANKRYGIEVTELVDQECRKNAAKYGKAESIWFSKEEITKRLNEVIAKKSEKKFNGEPFDMKVLLIHSDEASIAYGEGPDHISQFPKIPHSKFGEIWVVLPPALSTSPETGSMDCRIIKISLDS